MGIKLEGKEVVELFDKLKEIDDGRKTSREELLYYQSITSCKCIYTKFEGIPNSIKLLSGLTELQLRGVIGGDLPSEIGELTSLTSLILRENQLAKLPSEIWNLTSLKSLDLSYNSLTELPSEIGNLTSLTSLYLSYNSLTELPSEIGNLTSLTSLNLNFNRLTELPTEIGNLTSLTSLDLMSNSLNELSSEIGNLTSLTSLNLSFNRLTELPTEIGNLTSLTSLYLGNNKLTELPTEIGNLTSLTSLYLSYNSLTELPTEIGNLTSLTNLELSSNNLTELPSEIGNLTSLTSLELSSNNLTELPSEIGNLISLTSLYLNDNNIIKIPSEVAKLTSLKKLDLSRTKLSSFPVEINGLFKNLKFLGLINLSLDFLPSSILDMKCGFNSVFYPSVDYDHSAVEEGICIYNLSLSRQPVGLFLEDRKLIESYFAEHATEFGSEQFININEYKLIVLGFADAGKTQTIQKWVSTENTNSKSTEATEGIDIESYQIDNTDIRLNIWDFGGQGILHSMHRCFLTEECLYLVILRSRSAGHTNDLTQQARYWLTNITTFAPKAKVMIAVNHENNGVGDTAGLNIKLLNDEFPEIIVGNPIVYHAVSKDGANDDINILKESVEKYFIDSTSVEYPVIWYNILKQLRDEIDSDNKNKWISSEKFFEICDKCGLTDSNKNDNTDIVKKQKNDKNDIRIKLLDWFNKIGVCFSNHYCGKSDFIIANPLWLTDLIYSVINLNNGNISIIPDYDGCIKVEKIIQGIQHKKSTTDIDEAQIITVLDIMHRYELSVLQNFGEDEFIPSLFQDERPDNFADLLKDYKKSISVKVKYRFLPDNVIHKLMIFCKNELGVRFQKYYRYGFCTYPDSSKVYFSIERCNDYSELEITIYETDGSINVNNIFQRIKNKLDSLNQDMRLYQEVVKNKYNERDYKNREDEARDNLYYVIYNRESSDRKTISDELKYLHLLKYLKHGESEHSFCDNLNNYYTVDIKEVIGKIVGSDIIGEILGPPQFYAENIERSYNEKLKKLKERHENPNIKLLKEDLFRISKDTADYIYIWNLEENGINRYYREALTYLGYSDVETQVIKGAGLNGIGPGEVDVMVYDLNDEPRKEVALIEALKAGTEQYFYDHLKKAIYNYETQDTPVFLLIYIKDKKLSDCYEDYKSFIDNFQLPDDTKIKEQFTGFKALEHSTTVGYGEMTFVRNNCEIPTTIILCKRSDKPQNT